MYPTYTKNLQARVKQALKVVVRLCVVVVAVVSTANSVAASADWQAAYDQRFAAQAGWHEIDADYVLGIDRFDTDQYTEIIGWQIGPRWYFGRQDGLDSGLTVVWQQNRRQQVSVSKEGLRLTRRF